MLQAQLVDVQLDAVDLLVRVDRLPGEREFAVAQRPRGALDHLLELAAHVGDQVARSAPARASYSLIGVSASAEPAGDVVLGPLDSTAW